MQMNDITMLNSSQFLQSFELLMTSSARQVGLLYQFIFGRLLRTALEIM